MAERNKRKVLRGVVVSDKMDKLYDGTRVTVLGEESGWYKIEYNGQTGYVIKSAVVKD